MKENNKQNLLQKNNAATITSKNAVYEVLFFSCYIVLLSDFVLLYLITSHFAILFNKKLFLHEPVVSGFQNLLSKMFCA